jgi:glycosyltransferase involved in cell wall biosynthesis
VSPAVSVIIPAYNNAAHLPGTIDSALNQTFGDIEVVVVDDGSTDDTPAICAAYGDRIRYFRQENAGSATARNRGIAESSGEFIAFLDADDIWEPEKIAVQLAFMREHPQFAMTYTDKSWMDDDGRDIPCLHDGWDYPSGDLLDILVVSNYITSTSLVMVRRECLDEVGVFDQHPDMRCSQDVNLWLRIAGHHQIGFVPGKLVRYRYHAGGTSRNLRRTYVGKMYNVRTVRRLFTAKRPELEPLLLRREFLLHEMYARSFLFARKLDWSRRCVGAVLARAPWRVDMMGLWAYSYICPLLDRIRGRSDSSDQHWH